MAEAMLTNPAVSATDLAAPVTVPPAMAPPSDFPAAALRTHPATPEERAKQERSEKRRRRFTQQCVSEHGDASVAEVLAGVQQRIEQRQQRRAEHLQRAEHSGEALDDSSGSEHYVDDTAADLVMGSGCPTAAAPSLHAAASADAAASSGAADPQEEDFETWTPLRASGNADSVGRER